MSFPQRLLVFFVGVLMGGLLSLYILKQRGFERPGPPPQSPREAEVEAVPGILKAYEQRREPMQSRFIVDEFRERGAQPGDFRRVFVLEGRMPGQRLRIEEWQTLSPQGTTQVASWRISAVDRVVVRLQPGTAPTSLRDALTPLGARLLRRGNEPDTYVLILEQEGDARTVDQMMESLMRLGLPILAATPDYLDHQPTPDDTSNPLEP